MNAEALDFDPHELLSAYSPFVVYDSRETFHADSPAVMTDLVVTDTAKPYCNLLRASNGEIIAVASPEQYETSYPELSLDFLADAGDNRYASGAPIDDTDRLVAHGEDLEEDAARMHKDPALADKIYGHIAYQDGRFYLQYWFFYYANPVFLDRHQGDWEMIQINLDPVGKPESASYSQHRHSETRDWNMVGKAPTADPDIWAPIVFPALGSHANYYGGGRHKHALFNWPDNHDRGDGRGPIRPQFVSLDVNTPGWLSWPGIWGASRGKIGGSPHGPARADGAWTQPEQFRLEGLELIVLTALPPQEIGLPAPPPLPESITATREGDLLQVTYTYPPTVLSAPACPVLLLITVDSQDDTIPMTYRFPFDALAADVVISSAAVASATSVRLTAQSDRGVESISSPVPVA